MIKISIFLILFIYCINCDDLLQVQILMRHGARNPIFCNWDCKHWQETNEFGYLTPIGMRQHYVLGQWLSSLMKLLIKMRFGLCPLMLIGQIYYIKQQKNIYRTIQSALSNFYGMYPLGFGPLVPEVDDSKLLPPNPGSKTPQDLGRNATPYLYQPVPIHVTLEKDDILLLSFSNKACPNAEQIWVDNQKTPLYQQVNNYSLPLIQRFADEMGLNASELTITNLSDYQDTFFCHEWNNYVMPKNLSEQTRNDLEWLQTLAIQLKLYQTYEQTKMMSTPFLQNLLQVMNDKLQGRQTYKYQVYSAHDTTILLILGALNLTSTECLQQVYEHQYVNQTNCLYIFPGYASNLIFELYNSTEGEYVKLLHNGTEIQLNNQTKIPFQQFQQMLNGSFANYNEGCGIHLNEVTVKKTPIWAWSLLIVLVLLVILLGSVIIGLYFKIKNYTRLQAQERLV